MTVENKYLQLKSTSRNVGNYVDALRDEGQIDLDQYNNPIVIGFETSDVSGVIYFMVRVSRNQHIQTFTMKHKRANKPVTDIDRSDGWTRPASEAKLVSPVENKTGEGKERRRVSIEEVNFQSVAKRLIE